MNSIRQIQELNKRELENNISPNASWHTDYRDTAYVYIGGLPFELSEGDIITIFSQYGEPTYINLIRDKETGKSKGFAFLKYEDQRSTDLAVDNLGGAVIVGRTLKVDHTRYKKKDNDEGMDLTAPQVESGSEEGGERRKRRRTSESGSEKERPMLREERELAQIIREHDEDDPMKAFLIEEKKEEVSLALARFKDGESSSKNKSKSHKHAHHHRSRREKDGDNTRHRSRKDRDDRERRRSRSGEDDTADDRRRRRSGHERPESHSERKRSPRRESRERARGYNESDSRRERRRDS